MQLSRASNAENGAILFQIYDGQQKMIAYFRKRTTAAEARYQASNVTDRLDVLMSLVLL